MVHLLLRHLHHPHHHPHLHRMLLLSTGVDDCSPSGGVTVDMKFLIVSANGQDTQEPAIGGARLMLSAVGIPYDEFSVQAYAGAKWTGMELMLDGKP